MSKYDLALTGAQVYVSRDGKLSLERVDIGIKDKKIAFIGDITEGEAEKNCKLSGKQILPGLIDTQVHFREPGLEHKEDLACGTRGAILGGITGVFEMPNTNPSTTTALSLKDKLTRASFSAWCNYAFYIGASTDNAEQLSELEQLPGCCGIKVFMGSSTGNLLVSDDDTLLRVLKSGKRRVAIHSEDEFRLNERKTVIMGEDISVHMHPVWRDEMTALSSTKRIIKLAKEAGRPLHILHLTTKQEVEFLKDHKDICTIECTPQHLTLSAPECYDELGTYAQMNPPIRTKDHTEALWAAVNDRTIDIMGSDHAPHTKPEKERQYPASPSGMTGVQTTVPLMLDHVNKGKLTIERMIELLAITPTKVFGMTGKGHIAVGMDADFTVVDMDKEVTINHGMMASKSGWTPFHGKTVKGWPVATIIGGHIAMRDGEVIGKPSGAPYKFEK